MLYRSDLHKTFNIFYFVDPNNPNQGYGGQPPSGYPQPGYPQPGYPQPGYPQPGYPGGFQQPGNYPPGSYPQPGGYPPPSGGYPQPGFVPTVPHAAPYDPEDPEVKGFDFTDQSIRKGFIRKVYSILMVNQLSCDDNNRKRNLC